MAGPISGAALGGAWGELTVKKRGFDRDLDAAERKFSRTASSLERRADRLARNMKSAWNAMAVSGAAMGAAMGAATKMAADLESSMADLQKVTDVETMEAMKGEIQDMANTIPMATDELAKIATEAGRAGVEGAEALSEFTEVTSQLGFATVVTAERAAKGLSKIMQWLDIPGEYARNVGAAINELSNNLVANTDEIMRTLGKTAQQFQLLGARTSTTLGLSAAISSLADSAERGGTRLRRLLQEMREPRKIGKMADALGMTADEFRRMIDESPIDAIKTMAKGMNESRRVADSLSESLASTSRVTLSLLAGNLDEVNDALELAKEQLEDPTSLSREFGIAVSTLYSQLGLLRNVVKNLFIKLMGDQTLGVFTDLIESTKTWLHALYNVVDANEDVREAITGLLGAALHIFSIITAFGLLFKAVSLLLTPVTLLYLGFIALGAAWRWDAWGLKSFIESNAVEFFENLAKAARDLADGLQKIPDKPLDGLEKIFEAGKESPIATGAITLGISKLVFGLGGASLVGLVGKGLADLSGISYSAGIVTFGKALGLAVILPLLIEEFTSKQNKEELKEEFKESGIPGKIRAVINNYPISTTAGLWVSVTWGNLLWSKFAAPAASAIAGTAAVHAPWLYAAGSKFAGVSVSATTIGLTGIVLALAAGSVITAWKRFSQSEKDIKQDIMEGLGSVLVGGAIGAGVGSVLGNPVAGAAVGIGAVTLLLEITKLIPKFKKDPFGEEFNDKIDKVVSKAEDKASEGTEADVEFKSLSVEDFRERITELDKRYNKFMQESGDLDSKGLEKMRDLLEEIKTIMNELDIALDKNPALKQLLTDVEKSLEEKGYRQGGPVGMQKGGMAGFVPGTGSGDIIPAMLEPGEFVWPKEMVKRFPGIIKGMWQGFKKGGAVLSGKHYYGPGPEDEEDTAWVSDAIGRLEKLQEDVPDVIKAGEDVETFTKDIDRAITTLESLEKAQEEYKTLMEEVNKKQESWEDKVKGLTEETDIASLAIGELSDVIQGMDISQIGRLPEVLEHILYDIQEIEIPREMPPFGEEKVTSKKERDWDIEALSTLKDFDNKMVEIVDQLVSLEEVADKYGVAQDVVGDVTEDVRSKFVELTGDSDAFDKALEEARGGADGLSGKFDEISSKLSTVSSGLMEVAQATGELSSGASARLQGIASAGQSALQGDWLGMAMDLFTGFMTGMIEDMKERRDKLQEKLDAAFSMSVEGLRAFTNELDSATRELAGPFSAGISGALDGLVGFFEMTQSFVQEDTVGVMQQGFSALMSIVTGVTSSFIGLLQESSQWEALQSELDPIWRELADAFGTLLTPVVALARWFREYLGISKDVGDEAEKISDLNVPSGFKRARKVWEAAEPGQSVTGGTSGGGMDIPQWAREIIKPIKDKLVPYLGDSKSFLSNIVGWAKGIWGWIQKLILDWIPGIARGIGMLADWIENIDWETIFEHIGDVVKWFKENFPDAWEKFTGEFDAFMTGAFGEGGFIDIMENIDKNLASLAKASGVGVGAIGGAGIGAALGSVIPGVGTLVGAGVGAGLGGLAGYFGFQHGGVATKPVQGIVGEAGPEAVIPLDRFDSLGGSDVEVVIQTSGDGIVDNIIDEVQVRNKRMTGSRSTSAAINRRQYS